MVFVITLHNGIASRWPKAFWCLSEIVEIKFLNKDGEHFVGVGFNYLPVQHGEGKAFNWWLSLYGPF